MDCLQLVKRDEKLRCAVPEAGSVTAKRPETERSKHVEHNEQRILCSVVA